MAGKDIIEMRIKELKRLKIIHESIQKHITQKTAASIIGITRKTDTEDHKGSKRRRR